MDNLLLKKMEFDDILGYSFKTYKKNFFYFIKTFSWFFVPAIIITLLYTYHVMGQFKNIFTMAAAAQTGNTNIDADMGKFILSFYGNSFLYMLVYTILTMLAYSSVVKSAYEKIMGNELSTAAIAGYTLRKSFHIIITSLISMIMLFLGFMCCFIPGIILGTYLIYLTQAMIIENKFYFDGIGRSFTIIKNHFWSTLLIPLVFFIALMFISLIITYGAMIVPYVKLIKSAVQNQGQTDPTVIMNFWKENLSIMILVYVINYLLYLVSIPLLAIALTVKFINIRNLKEGTTLLNEIQKENV